MAKPRYKTTDWKQYNKALINRSSLNFWIDEEAIAEWEHSAAPTRSGKSIIAIISARYLRQQCIE